MSNSQQVSLLKRSILWLCVLIAVVGLTYYYQENLFKDGFDAITVSNTTKELPIYNVQTNKNRLRFHLMQLGEMKTHEKYLIF